MIDPAQRGLDWQPTEPLEHGLDLTIAKLRKSQKNLNRHMKSQELKQ